MNTLLSSVARGRLVAGAVAAAAAAGLTPLAAQADTGKLLLTGGVSTIEGAAGGGLSPWAVIGSQASGGEIGVAAYASRAVTDDYALTGYGVAVGLHDRFELSLAHQKFNTGDRLGGLDSALSGLPLKQDIFGAKYRIAGDAVLDSDTWMPQIAVGIQHKRLAANAFTEGVVEGVLGAKRSGTDVYVSATKLFLAQGLLVNGTLRATKANQNGLLGFGGNLDKGYELRPEISVAYLLRKDLAVGFEYRAMTNKLRNEFIPGALEADHWKDVFIAWAPSKNLSLTAAYVDLGQIAPGLTANRKQRGAYLSAQVAF
ncbi:DUF3034 family protein [Aquabacterium sp. A08]|uniref:DUF3034 family protein n=1 Tax=Aquabacterium sp. A08 TaxID=2718532 RepID=UPI0014207E7E|nr:DUF3034 family protein [Aquabacterium sp. A08]NIC40189.1 DUF3034 family protein [Aquabacterium sp. A08]